MTNKEVLKRYNKEDWVMREMLSYLLLSYADKLGIETPSVNPIAHIEDFMSSQTLINEKYAEESYLSHSHLYSDIIDVEYSEVLKDE